MRTGRSCTTKRTAAEACREGRRKKRPRTRRRGFSLITVFLMISLAALSVSILLRLVDMEHRYARLERIAREAVTLADNGAQEVMSDRLVDLPLDKLEVSYDAASDDPLKADGRYEYEAKLRLLRMDPIKETSMTSLRALVFEVVTFAQVNDGEATAEVAAEAYRVVGYAPGVVMPATHYR